MIPRYLYHYTNVEAVISILKSNSIKFTRLDQVNDPIEGIISVDEKNFENLKKLIYCSCWTDIPDENMSMWGIYKNFTGVRIKVQSDLFFPLNNLKKLEDGFVPYGFIEPIRIQGIKNTQTKEDIQINRIYGPMKVHYVQNEFETYKNAIQDCTNSSIKIPDNFTNISLLEMGNKKIDYWKYENEWRFKIVLASYITSGSQNIKNIDALQLKTEEKLFIPLKQPIIEIMTAPNTSNDDISKLLYFLNKNDLKIPLVKSKIKMK